MLLVVAAAAVTRALFVDQRCSTSAIVRRLYRWMLMMPQATDKQLTSYSPTKTEPHTRRALSLSLSLIRNKLLYVETVYLFGLCALLSICQLRAIRTVALGRPLALSSWRAITQRSIYTICARCCFCVVWSCDNSIQLDGGETTRVVYCCANANINTHAECVGVGGGRMAFVWRTEE